MDKRSDIIRTGRLLEQKGFTRAACGNISIRAGKGKFLITPSGRVKSSLKSSDILTINGQGKVLSGKGYPSTETLMHLMVYKMRPDVGAVIHSHPPYAVALTLAGFDIAQDILPEIVLTLGKIAITKYATPCTVEDAEAVKDLIADHDAMILPRHGSLTVGKTLDDAFMKLEQLEHSAKVISIAKMMGKITPLNDEQLEKLMTVKNCSF